MPPKHSEHTAVASERRKSPRTPVMIPVDYSTVDAFFSEFTTNINEGGMFVGTEQPHPVDTLVTVSIRLPGNEAPSIRQC